MVCVFSKLSRVGEPFTHAVLSPGLVHYEGRPMCRWQNTQCSGGNQQSSQVVHVGNTRSDVGSDVGNTCSPSPEGMLWDARECLPRARSKAVQVTAENGQPLGCSPKPCILENSPNLCLQCQHPGYLPGYSQNYCLRERPILPDLPLPFVFLSPKGS